MGNGMEIHVTRGGLKMGEKSGVPFGKLNVMYYNIQGVPKKVPLRVLRKGWVIFSKTLLNYKLQPISTSI